MPSLVRLADSFGYQCFHLSLWLASAIALAHRGFRPGFASAAFDTDAIIAAMENQSLAGHDTPGRIVDPRWRGRSSGQHILPGLAFIGQLFSGSAPALRTDHHVAARGHPIHLALSGLPDCVTARRHQK